MKLAIASVFDTLPPRGKSMRWNFGVFMVVILILVAACAPVFAHHGTAAYDETNRVTVKGTVTQFLWANPHTQIFLDVNDDKGGVTHWSTETFSPGKLAHMGWTKDSLKPGDQVSITLNPAKNGSPVGYLLKLDFADGRELGTQEQR
jgi:hypothetical protein